MTFSFGSRKLKLPDKGDMIVIARPEPFDEKRFDERMREIVGTDAILPHWRKEIQTLTPEAALAIIKRIANKQYDKIDGVVHPGQSITDGSVRHQLVPDIEKIVRIVIVLSCLEPQFVGTMPDAHSPGIWFEAYNRIHLCYTSNERPWVTRND